LDNNAEEDNDEEIDEINESNDTTDERIDSERDDAIVVFRDHQKPVLCCALNSDNSFAVSGSEDDFAYVWNIENGSVLLTCSGHKDSVVCVSFNNSDTYVATGDMKGYLQVWKMNGQKVFDYEMDNDLNWMLWHPIANNVLMAGTAGGEAWVWKVSGDYQCKTLQSFGSSNNVAKCFNDGNRVVMGYENGSVRVWDIKADKVIINIHGKAYYLIYVLYYRCRLHAFTDYSLKVA
jgi:angio-associated migratory cell protein